MEVQSGLDWRLCGGMGDCLRKCRWWRLTELSVSCSLLCSIPGVDVPGRLFNCGATRDSPAMEDQGIHPTNHYYTSLQLSMNISEDESKTAFIQGL